MREIEAKAKKEGRKTFTDEEQEAVDKANAAKKKLHEGAREKATGEKKPRGKTAAARAVRFFDFNDIPAKWEYKKFPVKVINGEEVVEYDIWRFIHGASQISEDAFNKLKAEFDAVLNKD